MPKKKYGKPVGVRLPPKVKEALDEKVKDKKKEFPRYARQDAIRALLVEGLKNDGYLDEDKHYL